LKDSVKSWTFVFREAVFMSWLATFLYGLTMGVIFTHGSPYISGGLALLTVLLAMNGLARTELWLTSRGPQWWKEHPFLQTLHHVSSEGEMAGIVVGLSVLLAHLIVSHGVLHVHLPISEACTLFGIMSVANSSAPHMLPILEWLSKRTGVVGVIFFGSLLSSITGEPAAAVFLSRFVDEAVSEDERARVATGLAATIGSGGGLLPFAAPPVLIVWGTLQAKLAWSFGTLFLFVGLGCVLHVAVVAWKVRKFLPVNPSSVSEKEYTMTRKTAFAVQSIVTIVALNIWAPHSTLVMTFNVVVGLLCLGEAFYAKKGFVETWQPLILAFLLMALEIIGHEADPLLAALASQIPETWNLLVIGLVLWYASAFTSHFADNALASRVYMAAAVSIGAASLHAHAGSFLAACVLLGALFGGFALIPANLPNFAISRILQVSPGEWLRTASKEYYYSLYVHVGFITCMYLLLFR